MLRLSIMTSLVIFTLVSQVHAASTKADQKGKAIVRYNILEVAPHDDTLMAPFAQVPSVVPEKSVLAMNKQEQQRKLASENQGLDKEYFESKMSAPMKEFRTRFLAVKNADELDTLLVEAQKNYETYPNDLKFVVAQAIPLRALRGIIWKMIPTVQGTKVFHSAILTQVKNMAVNMRIFLPTEQWKAGFDYITQPYTDDKGVLTTQFPAGDEVFVQGYVRNTVIPALVLSAQRLEKVDMSGNFGAWDNAMVFGNGSFPAAIDRYLLYGEAERYLALSYIYSSLSELSYQSAYSMETGLQLNAEIGRLYGWDGFSGKVDGVPASKRVPIITGGKSGSSKYPRWGVLFGDGKAWTNDALKWMGLAVNRGEAAWNIMKARPASELYLSDNSATLPFQRPIQARFANLKKMLEGPTEIHSFVDDEVAVVDVKNFYTSPPSDLKRMFATKFENEESDTEMIRYKNTAVSYRNYFYGRGKSWNISEYQRIFPKITTDAQLLKSARILSQGWGGFSVAMPLANYLN